MSHVQHELAQKFPDKSELIHQLKLDNAHFSKLFEDYHQINRRIHRIEAQDSNRSDMLMQELKAKRIVLLDQLTSILNAGA